MTVFWIMAMLAATLAGLLVLAGARRGVDRRVSGETIVGGQELEELDRLKARGLLDEDAWASARAEAGRRLIRSAEATPAQPVARTDDRRWVLTGVVVAVALAAGLYLLIGRPGAADQPYAARVQQWATSTETLEPAQVAAVIQREARANPDDPRLWSMLGAARFQAGDPIGAASAFRRTLALTPDDAQSWARLGESLVRSQEGVVGADAEAAFREALKRDPDQLGARFFLGDAALARGDRAAAEALWTPLIAALDPADARRADLLRRLQQPSGAAG